MTKIDFIGIFLGIVIGVISGVVILVLLRTMNRMSKKEVTKLLAVIGEFLAIPTFMFAGPYFASELIGSETLQEMALPYFATVSLVFGAITGPVVFKWVHRIAFELGQDVGHTNE